MARGFGRLPFSRRRSSGSDRADGDAAAAGPTSVDLDGEPIGPPRLLPAAIFRQVLVAPAEATPVWARPRREPDAEPVAPPSETAGPERTRRGPTPGTTKPARASSKSRSRRPRSSGQP